MYRNFNQCREGLIWQGSNCEEIGCLAQGLRDVKGTNTITFISVSAVPKGRKVTYLRVVSAMRPEKAGEPYRMRWTVGGDKVDYPFDVSTKTADLTTANKPLISQKRSLHAQCPVPHRRLKGFLPRHSNVQVRIHACTNLGAP